MRRCASSSSAARAGAPSARAGTSPGSSRWPRTKLLRTTGRRVSAARAETRGVITQAVPDDTLDEAAGALAAELAERAPLALRTLKMVLNRGAEAPLETALELERKAYAWLRSTDDYAEGVASFLEHRPAKYTGR